MNRIQMIANHLSTPAVSEKKQHPAPAPSEDETPFLIDSQGRYTDIVINRPKKMNSITPAMAKEFQGIITKFDHNLETKAVFIRKAGGPAFCAGGDLKSVFDLKNNGWAQHTYQYLSDEAVRLMSQARPTTIAFLDGLVMGTGVGLFYFSKIKIATENTMIAMPESKLGYFTDVGAGYFLSRLENGVGLYMMMTGEGVKGEDVVRTGLAHYFVESHKLEELLRELKEFVNNSKAEDVDEKALRSVVEKYSKSVEGRCSLEGFTKEHFEGKKSAEEVFESLKAKAEQDPKAKKTLALLSNNCPMSVKVTFELHRRAKTMKLEEVLTLELGLSDAVAAKDEFAKGVQRMLMKKDIPWNNESIYEIKESEIDQMFQDARASFSSFRI